MVANRTLIFASVVTLIQAAGQIFFTAFSLAQYYCVIDFLQGVPLVVFIRILYIHNPTSCGSSINIGHAVEGVANQALVLLHGEPFTATRTFILNCAYLALCGLWTLTSVIMLMGGAKNKPSKHIRWPWLFITVCISILDMVAFVMYANDSFHTRTLSDMTDYIGAFTSGIGNTEISTNWVSWTMALIYSRFVVLLAVNMCLVVAIVIDCGLIPNKANTPPAQVITIRTADESVQADVETSMDAELGSSLTGTATARLRAGSLLPRPGISHSFRRMKEFLFRRPSTPSARFVPSSGPSSPTRSLQLQRKANTNETTDKKRTVNFPTNLLSLPQRLENLIVEQQRQLDDAMTGPSSPPRASQSMPHLPTSSLTDSKGRRGTAAELQYQLPWSYLPDATSHPMREQLPPDEELPPVPLPDYTAIPSFRKASVHRAASSLSSLTQKKIYNNTSCSLNQSDVLY